MPPIADTLREAIADKEWTISQAAREAEVDRSFLSRLLSGHPPPRARDGRRGPEQDPRYSKLAEALGLEVQVFVDQVRAEQARTRSREADAEYGALAQQSLAAVQRRYEPDGLAELNLIIRRLPEAIQQAGGTMDFYKGLLALPALPPQRRARLSAEPSQVSVSNHRGRDPLWDQDDLPPLCDALVEMSYNCHTVDAPVSLDVRFDLAAVLSKLGTRAPTAIRQVMGLADA